MDEPRPFPPELLDQSVTERLVYFGDKILFHPKLKAVHNRLIRAIAYRTAPLIMVYGPTGVGKTTLRLRVEDEITKRTVPSPGSIPIASVAANSSSNGNFDWRDFYAAALAALSEPMLKGKRSRRRRLPPVTNINQYLPGLEPVSESRSMDKFTPVLELRWDFEQALAERAVGAFIIDEAQHLKQMTSGRRLLDQMNHIKSLANNTTVVYVLIGTYELLDLTNLSGQLSRRSLDIHFPRYMSSNSSEMQDFEDIVFNFQRALPLAIEPDLLSHLDECYEWICPHEMSGFWEVILARHALRSNARNIATSLAAELGVTCSDKSTYRDRPERAVRLPTLVGARAAQVSAVGGL